MNDHTATRAAVLPPRLPSWVSPGCWLRVAACAALVAGLIRAIGAAGRDADGAPSVPLRDPEIGRLYHRITPATARQTRAELEELERRIAAPLPVRQVLEYNRKLGPILVRSEPLLKPGADAADAGRALETLERRCAAEHPGEPLLTVAVRFVGRDGRENRTLFSSRDEPDRWCLLGLLDEIRNQLLGRPSARAQEVEPLDHTPDARGGPAAGAR
jgi:hypothetical protein